MKINKIRTKNQNIFYHRVFDDGSVSSTGWENTENFKDNEKIAIFQLVDVKTTKLILE